MTLLPIADRELRVAARKRASFWTRLIAAALAFFVFAGYMGLFAMMQRLGGGNINGMWIFRILAWMGFLFAAFAGVFLTSDALSEEKREGTLGLLFLTDLRGYDVVMGKVISNSLQAFYGLLAVFPIFALTLLFGGLELA